MIKKKVKSINAKDVELYYREDGSVDVSYSVSDLIRALIAKGLITEEDL